MTGGIPGVAAVKAAPSTATLLSEQMYPVAVASSSVAARVSTASYGVKLKVWLKLFD
jgi:hypothetical protein